MSGSNATASNLAAAFDIHIMSSQDSFNSIGNNRSAISNWSSNGNRMDRAVGGDFTIGGRGADRSFHGKVASMVVTNLRITEYSNTQIPMPSAAEIKMMITDPKKWIDDYKWGANETYRRSHLATNDTGFSTYSSYAYTSTQVWLMGDGGQDSYANGIRSEVMDFDQNNVKLQLNNMVSNDIENVTIPGLS